jgi:hypothetical protein
MFNRKLTTKLLFVSLILLLAASVPAPTVGKTVMGICFDSCDALDDACRAVGGGATPIACADILLASVHGCSSLVPAANPGAYVSECAAQGGTTSGAATGLATCTKVCL